MRVCLITYDMPHRKTNEVAYGLYKRGFRRFGFLLMPFTPRKKRRIIFSHRPSQFDGHSPNYLANLFDGSIHDYSSWRSIIDQYDYFLICGAGIIEPDFANTKKIINAHSGLIPAVRGLDSFKWAILNRKPLGNTLHCINPETDLGDVCSHLHTPVLPDDNLQSLSKRHYDYEIWMLINFDRLLDGPKHSFPLMEPTKRMPIETENEMLANFSISYMLGFK